MGFKQTKPRKRAFRPAPSTVRPDHLHHLTRPTPTTTAHPDPKKASVQGNRPTPSCDVHPTRSKPQPMRPDPNQKTTNAARMSRGRSTFLTPAAPNYKEKENEWPRCPAMTAISHPTGTSRTVTSTHRAILVLHPAVSHTSIVEQPSVPILVPFHSSKNVRHLFEQSGHLVASLVHGAWILAVVRQRMKNTVRDVQQGMRSSHEIR